MSAKDDETDENKQKYVTVVYHHISYQNLDGKDGERKKMEEPTCCNLVPETNGQQDRLDVPDYLPFTILSMFMFMPLGVYAVNDSFKVRKAVQLNDKEKAFYASESAIQHALSAFVTGPLVYLFVFLFVYIIRYSS